MAKIDLKSMDEAELETLIADARTALDERRRERRDKAIEEARRILAEANIDPKELVNGTRRRSSKAAAGGGQRIVNPKDSTQVWGGRGRRPKWVTEQMVAAARG